MQAVPQFERFTRVIGLAAIAAGLLLAIGALAVLADGWSWYGRSASASGTVVAHDGGGVSVRVGGGSRSQRASYAEVVSFTDASGALHEFKSRIATSDPFAVGASVPVRYDPGNPADATIDTWFRLWGFPLIFVGAGVLMAVLGGVFVGFGSRFVRASA
jgi:hypothetical protein